MKIRRADRGTPGPEGAPAPVAPLSNTVRRSGRLGTRLLALLSLIAGLAATALVVTTLAKPGAPEPLAAATAQAWTATGALSDALRALRPGARRAPARALASAAAPVVTDAAREVRTLDLPTSDTPRRARVLTALSADRAWIAAVRATLKDPASPRRSDLTRLSEAAATATSLIAKDVEGAAHTIGGTSRLMTATKQKR